MPVEHENRTGWHEPCIEWNMGEGEYGCGRRRGFQGEIDGKRERRDCVTNETFSNVIIQSRFYLI